MKRRLHRWEMVHKHKHVCVNCGWVRLHIPERNKHIVQFERNRVFAKQKTPECDGVWPKGWHPDRNYSMFLDDVRDPPRIKGRTWIVVRSFAEATSYVERHGIPSFISFDHDLGEAESGMDFAKWMVSCHLDGKHVFPNKFDYKVHSANPVGAENITSYLESFRRFREIVAHNAGV